MNRVKSSVAESKPTSATRGATLEVVEEDTFKLGALLLLLSAPGSRRHIVCLKRYRFNGFISVGVSKPL